MFIYFDLETTGFSFTNDEIIEIYLIKEDKFGNIVDTFHSYFYPGILLPFRITEITKITDKMLENKKEFKEHANEIIEFIGNGILIGHNIDKFDLPFLNASLEKNNFPKLLSKTHDTMKIARNKDNVSPLQKGYRLIDLANKYNLKINASKFHGAKFDTEITRKIYHILTKDSND